MEQIVADSDAVRRLAANDFAYRELRREVDRLRARADPKLLSFIEGMARFAWEFHPGRLADGALENPLLAIGRAMADDASASMEEVPLEPSAQSRTLHVASEVYATGGHSRILAKWVQRDLSSSHAIVLTRHDGKLPEFLTLIAAERGAPITTLDRSETILARARQLRALSLGFDRVILHHHPDDAVPVIAYAKPGGCPVAMFNHAHFWFSLGSSVSDAIINTTPFFRQLTKDLRFPRATDLLHGPPGLERLRWSDVDKRKAKERLGLSADGPVAMTIGNEVYYTPSKSVDFFGTLGKLLAERPDLQVLIVGVREGSPLVPSTIRDAARVRLLGPVPDPRPFYEAADICLESFPFPSLGALVEAPAYGQAFPVPAFAEGESPLHINQQRIADIAVRQRTEAEYIRYVGELLDAREATLERAGDLRHRIIRDDESFGEQFVSLYERIARLDHAPHELPRTNCVAGPDNLVLASRADSSGLQNALAMLPLPRSIRAHVRAVAGGHEGVRAAALQVARGVARPVFRRLPGQIRDRLRPR